MNAIKTILAILAAVTLFAGTSVAYAAGFAESSFMQYQTLMYATESMYQLAFAEVKRVATSNNRGVISAHVLEKGVWNSYSVVNPVRVDPETREILLAYGPSKRVGDRDEVVVIVDSNMDGEADYTYRECATGCIRTEATEHDRAEYRKRILMVFSHIEDPGL
ncbi:hypothetical protein H6784_02060 [Candidatus Nomurabacteria bacterium]|nr:hypothetical protein [Candidatus Kaiserbacteria bacterium]MCB9814180.1 hypothetical protein [Candidatus Nomurabacteria bacterium]